MPEEKSVDTRLSLVEKDIHECKHSGLKKQCIFDIDSLIDKRFEKENKIMKLEFSESMSIMARKINEDMVRLKDEIAKIIDDSFVKQRGNIRWGVELIKVAMQFVLLLVALKIIGG